MKNVKWAGSTNCDSCSAKIVDVLYDAKTVYGSWGTLCHTCYGEFAYAPGVFAPGVAQKYKENENHEFIKVRG